MIHFQTQAQAESSYALSKERKIQKAIADFLSIQAPPVIEQLRRLQKIGAIRLGEKEGKEQNYEINWHEFLDLFIVKAIQQNRPRKEDVVLEEEHPEEIEKIKTLRSNSYFRQLVLFYVASIAESDPSNWRTISEAIGNFENALRQSAAFKRNKEFEEKEKQDFFDNMRIWYNRTLSAKTWMDICLHDAIYKTLREQ